MHACKLSTLHVSAPRIVFHHDQVIFALPSLQSVLLTHGAEFRLEASAVLRSLNLPQHTGMLSVEHRVLQISSVFLRLCACVRACAVLSFVG